MPEIALLTQTPLIVLWESATGQRADTLPAPHSSPPPPTRFHTKSATAQERSRRDLGGHFGL